MWNVIFDYVSIVKTYKILILHQNKGGEMSNRDYICHYIVLNGIIWHWSPKFIRKGCGLWEKNMMEKIIGFES